jgi:hypothetical protein
MREGRLSISRGSEIGRERSGPRLTLVPDPPPQLPVEEEASARTVDDRLTALERLAALRARNLLTEEEFAAEKALVRGVPPETAAERGSSAQDRQASSPSLLGRMFSWKFIPIGLVAGLALSFGAQPRQTMRVFDQFLLLLGA